MDKKAKQGIKISVFDTLSGFFIVQTITLSIIATDGLLFKIIIILS